jgi:predicted nuclease of restriction endonuclease-like (RecB) superfamily
MGKCKNDLDREFYIRMTKKYGWTKSVLIHQIESETHGSGRLLNKQNTTKIAKRSAAFFQRDHRAQSHHAE